MNQFAGMSDTQLYRLRGQLVNDLSPQGRIQLERVLAELSRRRRGQSAENRAG
jgi:hypothetical protein